jgi:hypothetical protein
VEIPCGRLEQFNRYEGISCRRGHDVGGSMLLMQGTGREFYRAIGSDFGFSTADSKLRGSGFQFLSSGGGQGVCDVGRYRVSKLRGSGFQFFKFWRGPRGL